MFKLNFYNTYNEYTYVKYNLKPIVEDFYKVDENLFCVADGITMDLLNGEYTPYPSTKEQAEYILKNYPNPSGSFKSAYICCTHFFNEVKKYGCTKIDIETLKKIVSTINKDIWEINKNRKIDYAPNDLYCCEACGGIINNNNLYCFSIGDSQISLFDKNYNLVFVSDDNVDFVGKYIDKEIYKNDPNGWTSIKNRQIIRKNFRNNPKNIVNNTIMSYGALSGENSAMDFVHFYKINLEKVKYICAYTDGFKPFIKDAKKVKDLISSPINFQNVGNEKTLVIYTKVD